MTYVVVDEDVLNTEREAAQLQEAGEEARQARQQLPRHRAAVQLHANNMASYIFARVYIMKPKGARHG